MEERCTFLGVLKSVGGETVCLFWQVLESTNVPLHELINEPGVAEFNHMCPKDMILRTSLI